MALEVNLTCCEGDNLFRAGKVTEAKSSYWKRTLEIVGPDWRIPAVPSVGEGGVRNEKYDTMHPFRRTNLMACCVGLARCLLKENDIESALAWLEEVNSLYRCTYLFSEKPLYDWFDFSIDIPELSYRRATALSTSSDIFHALDNSGTAAHRRWIANTSTLSLPQSHRTPRLLAETNAERCTQLTQLRHPDPASAARLELKNANLQIRGSWAKLPIKRSAALSRFAFASFIWNSRLYVAGGQKDSLGPFYRDFWYLDLTKLDEWKQLPRYPNPMSSSGAFLNWSFVVYNNKAFLFNGRSQLDYFDLVQGKWESIITKYTPTSEDRKAGVTGSWPWPGTVTDSAQQVVGDKLFVFGGAHGKTSIGCNLFMELDLKTNTWRRLTGYVVPPPENDYSCPGPRKNAGSWVGKDINRFYLLFGHCSRDGAYLKNEPHGSTEAYGFDDMWSWDIKKEKWRRERFPGNPPCPRTEFGCTYNEKLNKVIVFGGYNPSLPTTVLSKSQSFNYSYFADTFTYTPPDPDAPPRTTPLSSPNVTDSAEHAKWRQVLTRGFPTYRCQAQLMADDRTGKTYLFGGFTNTDFVPSRGDYISRTFGDVWQLKLDEPGGFFEGVNLEEEARTAKAGPWQRCFSCGDTGPWRKCGGTCNGRAFFCNSDCQKDGWKEHKRMHTCAKKT
ncbi:hypothetical protein H2248_007875 [Termitomyces sp. 'cryptogamus']|nr:hypothetical protein H2248_007875 [Termitomyces sp. 'cryptogamus']